MSNHREGEDREGVIRFVAGGMDETTKEMFLKASLTKGAPIFNSHDDGMSIGIPYEAIRPRPVYIMGCDVAVGPSPAAIVMAQMDKANRMTIVDHVSMIDPKPSKSVESFIKLQEEMLKMIRGVSIIPSHLFGTQGTSAYAHLPRKKKKAYKKLHNIK